ncbi:hypothetical protein BDQ17DRAFT_1374365 [Cyathus striatus]|nr:hypothetical protein BDQ17DRAFT_1374365 [Cyathus striatus]
MDPVISDLTLLVEMLEAAMKYEMIVATTILTNHLRTFVQDEPLKLFAAAYRLHLEEIASLAAHRWREIAPKEDDNTVGKGKLADWKQTIAGSSYITDMAGISAGAYFRLTEFVRTGVATSFTRRQESSSLAEETLPKILDPSLHSFKFPDSDLTILSSDQMRFHVHQIIIRLASPVILKDATFIEDNGKQVLLLPEDGQTLSLLLRSCYPSTTMNATIDIQYIPSCLRAAVKYQMTKVIDNMITILKIRTRSQPLDVYFAFIMNGFMEEGAEVAQNILIFKPLSSLYHPLMERLSALSYHCLLEQRHRCMSCMLAIGSNYESDRCNSQWWTPMKSTSSDFIYLAGPVVERRLSYLVQKSNSCYRCDGLSQTDSNVTLDLHTQSIKLKEEFESSIAEEALRLATCLHDCGSIEL